MSPLHEHLFTMRRRIRLRDGRRQRRRTVLVHEIAARGRAAARRRRGRMLVPGLPGAAYRATGRQGAGYVGRVGHVMRRQRAVRKNRIISRLALGPLPSV